MSVNVRFEGSPESIRASGEWMRTKLTSGVHDCVSQIHKGRTSAEAGWTGAASEGFRGTMRSGAPKGDDLATEAETMGRSVEQYADQLHTAQKGAERAKQIARDGGLTVTDTQILSPGPAPSQPASLPADATPQAREAHGNAMAAAQAHEKKAAAYAAAKQEADRANSIYEQAKKRALNAWQTAQQKAIVHAGEFVQGSGGGLIQFHQKILRAEADRLFQESRDAHARYLKSPGGSTEAQFHAQQQQSKVMQAEEAKARAVHAERGAAGIAVRAAGRGLAVGGVAWDISHGKPPGKAIFSGALAYGGGVAATAGVTMLVSNPVGWAAVGIGAAGVGGGILVGMAGDALWDAMPDGVTNKINEGVEAAGSAIGDAAKSTWDALF